MIPSRDDVLTTLCSLVTVPWLRRLACVYAGFPSEHLPHRDASLAMNAVAVIDLSPPDVWARFVDVLAEESPGRNAEIALLRKWAPSIPPRSIFAAVSLDGSGVWAIGGTEEEARAGALERRDLLRDEARSVDCAFPDASTDAAWLDGFAIVTISGTTESLRTIVEALDDVIPWCPTDLWDSGEVKP